jgi:lysozyme family protein
MATKNFKKSLDRVLVYEGGYSNHPSDPGGATMKGVIQRVYDGYRRRNGLPLQEVSRINSAELQAIYRQQYWNAIKGDDLPVGVDFVMFDGAVNSGSAQSVKWLQRSLQADGVYHGPIDGDCSVSTLAAVQQHPDHDALIAGILSRRLGMLKALKTWSDFGGGWSKRVSSVRAIGQAWAMGSVGPQPSREVAELSGNAKGYAGDVAMALFSQESGTNTAAGGTGLAAVVQGAQQTLSEYAYISRWIAYVFIGLTVLGAVIAIGGAVSAFISSRQNKRAQAAIDGGAIAELPPNDFEDEPVLAPVAATARPRRNRKHKRKG